jgi:hypothetical protein
MPTPVDRPAKVVKPSASQEFSVNASLLYTLRNIVHAASIGDQSEGSLQGGG